MNRKVAFCVVFSGLFAANSWAGTLKVLYTFKGGTDGAYATGAPLVIGSTLYGATLAGGAGDCGGMGCGTVYALDINTGVETILHSFTDSKAGEASGRVPEGGLSLAGSLLYGTVEFATTEQNNKGQIFSLDPVSGSLSAVYRFTGAQLGNHELIQSGFTSYGGLLYGTSLIGPQNAGFVYSLNPASDAVSVLYHFTADQQLNSPTVTDGTTLYGTTQTELYSLDLASGHKATLYTFNKIKAGYAPTGGLLLVSGVLYGVDMLGGKANCAGVGQYQCGVVFSYDLTSKMYQDVALFHGPDGAQPGAGLTLLDGLLYGTTVLGGANNTGTLYAFDPKTGTETVLSSFPASAISQTASALIAAGGALYGSFGQLDGHDVVYRFKP